jgi:membrane-associated phospholipid phosphatase
MPAFGAVALLIALSRLILQKHYLSDIIGGAMVGLFASAFALY